MQDLPPLEFGLSIANLALVLTLVVRLAVSGLLHVYKFFFAYVVLSAIQEVAVLVVPFGTNLYLWVYLITEGLLVVLSALVVLELYSVVFSGMTGIATLSRRYIKFALAAAIFVTILLLLMEKTPKTILQRFFTFECAVVSSVLAFVFLITLFLIYYPVPLNRNVIVYSIGYAVYFLSSATALFIRNLGLEWDRIFSPILLAVASLCLIFWIAFLGREGESRVVVLSHRWAGQNEDRLIAQLQEINATLLRTARK